MFNFTDMIKLLYLFIHDYGNIKNQGFNLSSDFSVHFDPANRNLTVEKQEGKFPHLFHGDIIDVKGIVGENGAGKSTLLHYLSTRAHEPDIGLIDGQVARDMLVFLDGPNLCVNAGKDWQLNAGLVNNHTDLNWSQSCLTENTSHIYWEDIPGFNKVKFIFYSNVFDNKPELSFNGLLNISTNALCRKDVETRTNNQVRESTIESHRLLENQRQFEFAIAGVSLPFDLPEDFLVRDNDLARRTLMQKDTTAQLSKRFRSRVERWLVLSERYGGHQDTRPFERMVQRAFFNQLILNTIVKRDRSLDSYFEGYEAYTFQLLLEILRRYLAGRGVINLNKLLEKCEALEKNVNPGKLKLGDEHISVQLGAKAISGAIREFITFEQMLRPYYRRPRIATHGFLIPISEATVNLYRAYIASKFLLHYLDFFLPGLSSGELGYLTLFSRFYALISGTHSLSLELEDHYKDLVILIDEGDLYFHPQWQTRYLAYLNKLLPEIFPGRNLQLLITSHSQFLPSDLPKANLLFMKRAAYQVKVPRKPERTLYKAEVVEGPEYTFATNIHDLLTDSFFLDGAHMGDFAKAQLYKLLDILEQKERQSDWNIGQIKALIAEVGEPWMRSRLEEKLDAYTNENGL